MLTSNEGLTCKLSPGGAKVIAVYDVASNCL